MKLEKVFNLKGIVQTVFNASFYRVISVLLIWPQKEPYLLFVA